MNPFTSEIALPEFWRRKHLSPAEQKVVELIAIGFTTKEAATKLNKSTLTARNQLENAMRKLGVRTRYELIAVLRPLPAALPPIKAEADCLEYAI